MATTSIVGMVEKVLPLASSVTCLVLSRAWSSGVEIVLEMVNDGVADEAGNKLASWLALDSLISVMLTNFKTQGLQPKLQNAWTKESWMCRPRGSVEPENSMSSVRAWSAKVSNVARIHWLMMKRRYIP